MNGFLANKWAKVFFLAALTSAGISLPAYACSICMLSFFDFFMPPILLWCAFLVAWYLATAFALFFAHERSALFGPIKSPAIAISLVVFGMAAAGPVSILPLAIPCLYVPIKYITFSRRHDMKKWHMGIILSVGILGVIGLATMIAYSMHLQHSRTRIDYMLRWPGSPVTRGMIRRLDSEGPTSLSAFRELARRGSPFILFQVAPELVKMGDPEVDVPILIDALERMAKIKDREVWERESVEKCINELGGLEVPTGSDPSAWANAWRERPLRAGPAAKSKGAS